MLPRKVTATPSQQRALEVAHVGLSTASPFFAHLFYSEMKEYLTDGVPTAATDGKHIFINPKYFEERKPPERIFILAHEVLHWVYRHAQRMAVYRREGKVRDTDWDQRAFNVAADYQINALLINEGIGLFNPSWLFHPSISGEMLTEDVYEYIWQKPLETGRSGTPGLARDKTADAQGGAFDEVLEPYVDPATGQPDVPSEAEFKEALVRAATAAKAMGKLPASLQRLVEEIVEPQVDWREHIRQLMMGHVGSRRESWERLNRRRLVLNPLVFMPGKRGYGCETVAVVIDNSGSIGERELSAFFGEVSGIVNDIKPKRVILIWCDARVQQVDEARSLDELCAIRAKGSPGGGGTSFIPPFEWLEENHIKPETLVYLTDGYGQWPEQANFPVVWAINNEHVDAPWGEVVRFEV